MSDKTAIIKEAQKYLARGQIDKAIAEWEKLVAEYPDGNAFNTIGDLYLKGGNQESAINYFHKAADYFRTEGFSLKALALYKKVLNLNSSDAASLLAVGELNEEKGLVTDAIKFYLAAADSLSKGGKKDKLLEIYEKIISLSPSNIPLRIKIADIYTKQGLSAEAMKHYLQIAGIYAEKGQAENAIDNYRKVLDIEPANKGALLGLTSFYEKSGKTQKAMEQVKDAFQIFPQDVDILLKAAELHIAAGSTTEAKQYLSQITESEPANIKAKKLLGDLYIKDGDRERGWKEYLPVLDEMIMEEKYDDAIQLLESFKDIDPLETGKRLVSLYRQLDEQAHVASELVSLGNVFLAKTMQKEALNCFKEALAITPEDDELKAHIVALEKDMSFEAVSTGTEKPLDEALIEADIFIRYGLYDNALALLENHKLQEPDSIDLHLKLKSIYTNKGNTDQAVTECLVLKDLYEKSGDHGQAQQVLHEASQISPRDERLAGFEPPPEKPVTSPLEEVASLEDYQEELAEADFYAKQGLVQEARDILEKLQSRLPGNEEIGHRLTSLTQIVEPGAKEGVEEAHVMQQEADFAEGEIFEPQEVEPQEIEEPELDSDVMDIFNEFKKGIEKELEEEDYETHYNLGIAYKEMGLLDDAIREFQTAKNDSKKFVSSSNMLGLCYMEKGLYSLAIEVFKSAVENMKTQDEAYWAMKYDLAEAYEKDGKAKDAFELYTEVYGWNAKFKSVSDKISHLKTRVSEDTDQKKPRDRKDRVSYI
jgi:tetratricopeptide (TPR) repeat protein